MRRALIVAFVACFATISCSDDEKPKGVPSQPVDTGLPIVEAGDNDTGTIIDGGVDAEMDTTVPADTSMDDTAVVDSGTTPSDAISSTKDTEVDAIFLEAGFADTRPDTELPDVNSLSDTRIDAIPDSPTPF